MSDAPAPSRDRVLLLFATVPDNRTYTVGAHAELIASAFDASAISRVGAMPKFVPAKEVETYGERRTQAFYPFWLLRRALAKRKSVDWVWSSTGWPSIVTGAILKLFGKRWIVDVWDDPLLFIEVAKGDPIPKRLVTLPIAFTGSHVMRRLIGRADIIVFTIHPDLFARMGWKREKAIFATNGVHLENVATQVRGLPPAPPEGQAFRVTYVGFVKKIRGVDTVLAAAARVSKDVPDLRVELIGPGSAHDFAWVRSEAERLGIAHLVETTGEVPHAEVLRRLVRSDVAVFPFPSNPELDHIYPVKVFEYMAMQKAIISSSLPGVATILHDGENGLLVPPSDPDAWAAALRRLHADPALRAALGARARKDAEAYDWTSIAAGIRAGLRARGAKVSE